MKAVAVAPEKKQVKVVDHPEPKVSRPTDVMIKIVDVGICGTDKEICSFQYGTPPGGSEHLVLGHEALGQVQEVGPEVRHLKKGDLVVPMVRRPCVTGCPACAGGRQDFCFTGTFTERGINMAHGFMTELAVDEERFMSPLSPELRDVGVLVEPLTIAEKSIRQMWDVQSRLPWCNAGAPESARGTGRNAVVFGAGPVGLLGAMALVSRGFRTYVYSLELPPHPKSEVTEAMGATYVSASTDNLAALAERVGSIDVVYEAAGASKLSFDLLQHLGVNGVFILTGVPGHKPPAPIDTDLLMRNMVLKNQVLLGTVNANKEAFDAASQDLAGFNRKWGAALRKIITERHSIDNAPELLVSPTISGIKNIIRMG